MCALKLPHATMLIIFRLYTCYTSNVGGGSTNIIVHANYSY